MTTFVATGLVEQLSEVATAVETIPRRHGRMGSQVTKFASRKNRSVVVCESLLEAAFCLELERRNDVVSYAAHPFTLEFNGTNFRYTPDFLVSFSNGSQRLIEVKNNQSFEDNATCSRIARYAELLALHGCLLEYLAASDFSHPTRTANLAFLYHQAFSSYGQSTVKLCALLASRQQPMSIGALLDLAFTPMSIAHAIFYGAVGIDLSRQISCSTAVQHKRECAS
ncbi:MULTISPECIES: TnsA endonuclease N-terminal domain-containing protein [Pseudomonas]|uniref:TnsA endonuclease N-terminal domain-containing protein n=1 Tax=Pseudomonas TaxID=286 RepID=UPI001683F0FE|nr:MULTISPECIES: TnsA endonuclease N-terminal domain-containing protein [Pseudomonas]MBD1554825.1 transposase [Pseudomonas typographi]